MRSGTMLTQLVEFTEGFPDGNIDWEVLDGQGLMVASGAVVPAVGSASAVVAVTALQNTVQTSALSSPRELSWSYTVGGILQSGRKRYQLEAFLPWGISEEGVRRKLGIESHELADDAIDLVAAYVRFRDSIGAQQLAAREADVDFEGTLVRNAIEATAAISQIPSLQVSLAARESSGTDQFQRAAINWDAIRAQLDAYVYEGSVAVSPAFDPTANFGSLLIAIVREDPVTGETT